MVNSPVPAQPSASDSLANRYGRSQSKNSPEKQARRRRWGIIIAVTALILAVALAGVWTYSMTEDRLSYKDVGFDIVSEDHATVRFQLTKEHDATVSCAVQVLADNYAVVGWKTVIIGPEAAGEQIDSSPSDLTSYYDVQVRTDGLGTNGGVNDCWYYEDGPSNISYFDVDR
ncbi:DUF4307 domain-containing protein [Auritidibacter ignavus]|uniref:DUF4307 domain-containing protein n=1 Tax=Auritidibacter ignavus TaxID=678932 RepID=UPI00109D7F21|nr:DUF4307 domain-containing protein [Auritidibacter ignavus]